MRKLTKFCSIICAFGLVMPTATASLIASDLTITGAVEFDTVNSTAPIGNASQSAEMSSIIGGVTTITTVNNVTPTGANPLGGGLTNTGDGVGVNAQVNSTGLGSADGIFFDLDFSLSNSSLTDSYTVFFELAFTNFANADGVDSYVDAEINLFNSLFNEIFFSDLTSDTYYGDKQNGNPLPSSGATLTDSGNYLFDITLAPGAANSFSAFVGIDGDIFEGNSAFDGRTSAYITVLAANNLTPPSRVPEPSTIMLFAGVMVLLIVKSKVINI
jgi:hypothetical protein